MISHSKEETQQLGKEIAQKLSSGDVLALIGDLGAGKTTFVQGLASGLGVAAPRDVRSPTFILLSEYQGRLPLTHIDFYRLNNVRALDMLGLEEYFNGNGVTVIEWADRFPNILPSRTLTISLKIIDETRREIVLPPSLC